MAEGMPKGQQGFQVGHAPIGGRPLGSRNANAVVREYFRNATVDLFPDFLVALKQIKQDDPKAFVDAYLKMSERVIPKIAALQFETEAQTSSASDHLRAVASWGDENKK